MVPTFTMFNPMIVKYGVAEEEGTAVRQLLGVLETYERMAPQLQQFKPRHLYFRYPTQIRDL